MMGAFFDDNVPFTKKVKDIADKIEENRKQVVEGRRQRYEGTFRGLEQLIAKRKQEASSAK